MNETRTYKAAEKTFNLNLTTENVERIEKEIGKGIREAIKEPDSLSLCLAVIGQAAGSKENAKCIYEDMLENGRTFEDFQMLMFELLSDMGFIGKTWVAQLKAVMNAREEAINKLLSDKTVAEVENV